MKHRESRNPAAGPGAGPGGEAETLALLRRASVLRALAWTFTYPGPGHRAALLEALEALEGADAEPLAGVTAAWRAVDEDAARAAYSRLFLGAAPCPLNEASWCNARNLSGAMELSDIQGFYRAFGFTLADSGRETGDHLSAELEFLAALLVKVAYARFQGWGEASEVTHSALARFLEAHPGRWISAFAARLLALEAEPPYHQAASALDAVLRSECAALGVHPALVDLPHDADGERDTFACPLSVACGHAPD
jgi:TorA maturation chaperone TorD